ncbi:MAG TPA: translocation/assembly module TamB domain-containing protein, partial [Oceanipulchritudo sp.]|nr:translocation/assembly module TamB domain-containing protein [Oceanipulchritudo sp.]
PIHSGQIQPVGLAIEGLHPLELTADWDGNGIDEASLALVLTSDQGSLADLELKVLWKPDDKQLTVVVDDLVLLDPEDGLISLDEPCSVELDFSGATNQLRKISPIRLTGESLTIEGAFDGDLPLISAKGSGIDLRLLENWLDTTIPPIRLHQFSASVTGMRPNLIGAFELQLEGANPRHQALSLYLTGILNEEGIRFDSLEGKVGAVPFIHGNLDLPILLNLFNGGERSFSPIPGQSLQGTLTADISPELAKTFPKFDFFEAIPEVSLNIRADGTPLAPVASIEASLSHLEVLHLLDERLIDYPLEEIQLSARLSPNSIELRTFSMVLKGARLSANGSIPTDSLAALFQEEQMDLDQLLKSATLSISCQNFTARAFSSLLPDYMRPTGRVDGSLALVPGKEMTGSLELSDFSLRPTLYSQTVEGINLLLNVNGTRLTLTEAGASIGRSKASVTGFIDLADRQAPVYALKLEGTRVPLIRTPDLMVFGDVDLHLDGQDPSSPTRLSGSVALRDSLLLLEIDPLAAQTTGKNLAKPPFFSIDAAPFKDWILDVNILGDDCLRFKSPYARAVLSAQMDMEGTLGAPIWVGNIYSSDGIIDFPGIRTTLSRSDVFVTRERQDILQLDINALGQVSSYVISVSVSGTTDDPHVTFASTPDLSNAEVLQFLATGSPSRSGVSSVGFYLGKGLISPGGDTLFDRVSVEIGR